MLREEKTVGQLAAEYEVHSNMLYRWREQALTGLPSLFSEQAAQELAEKEAEWQKEREALYAEIGRLTTQVTWLEKNLAQGLSRQERLGLVDWENKELAVSTQAQLLKLNRSGLYYQPVPPSSEEVALKHRIDELYTAHPYYGYRRITAQLQREGQQVNHKAVARHMREMGLAAIYPGPNLSKRAHQAAIYPYLLGNITANAPNHIWGLDITYIRLRSSWMYLVAILDWYSRYVVSWELDQTMQVAFEIEAMRRALTQATPQICNSDQGSQFTSPQYTQLLLSHGVRISMDSKGRALDNIFTERVRRCALIPLVGGVQHH
jgi:putative transposase